MAVKWCGWIAEECGRIGKGPSAFVHFCTTWKPDQKGFQCRQNAGCGWCRVEWICAPTWEVGSRCSLMWWSPGVPQEQDTAAFSQPRSWLGSVFLICPLIKQYSHRFLKQQVPLLMCVLMGTMFSRDMFQIQMHLWETPFTRSITEASRKDAHPLLSLTGSVSRPGTNCPYSRKT